MRLLVGSTVNDYQKQEGVDIYIGLLHWLNTRFTVDVGRFLLEASHVRTCIPHLNTKHLGQA